MNSWSFCWLYTYIKHNHNSPQVGKNPQGVSWHDRGPVTFSGPVATSLTLSVKQETSPPVYVSPCDPLVGKFMPLPDDVSLQSDAVFLSWWFTSNCSAVMHFTLWTTKGGSCTEWTLFPQWCFYSYNDHRWPQRSHFPDKQSLVLDDCLSVRGKKVKVVWHCRRATQPFREKSGFKILDFFNTSLKEMMLSPVFVVYTKPTDKDFHEMGQLTLYCSRHQKFRKNTNIETYKCNPVNSVEI